MREIGFAWVCRNIKFDEICREELTDEKLLNGSYPSYITSDNCEIIAKILPIGKKDKKGKEIWEGDVLQYVVPEELLGQTKHGPVPRVKYYNCVWRKNGFYLESQHEYPFNDDKFWYHIQSDCEIIGNIYEDEGLLK